MCDVEIKINASWQLVSQFVSWDFCRFMCEQNESQSSGTDVLTFLRNMVVARTEKRATDITKHEIVAKFIMEARTIQSKTRMPCIITLSDTVIKICPELKSPMQNLLHHLENLLNVLDWNEDSQKDELILARIQQSVNEFSVEACKLLPLPDLLQVVSSWISPELQSQVWKARQKNVTNIELYQRVVHCLQEETITVFEAKTIAKALYEDKTLEKIINSETETDPPDSQQNTPSFHLQPRPTFSEQSFQQSPQGSSIQEKQLDSAGLFTLEPVYVPSEPRSQLIQSSLPFSQNSLDPSEQYRLTEGIQNLGPLNPIESYLFKPVCPEPLFSTLSPKHTCPQVYLEDSQSEVDHSPQKNRKSSMLDNTLSSEKRQKMLFSFESDKSPRNLSPKGACPQVYLDESQSEVDRSPIRSRKSSKLDNTLLSKKRRKILSSPESDNSPRKSGRVSSPEPIFFTAPVETPGRNFVPDDSDSADFSRKKDSATSKKRKKKCPRMIESDLDLSDVEVDRELIAPQRTSYVQKSSNNNASSNLFADSGSDTSDCDKNPEFRFLTPTMYKTGTLEENSAATNRVIWMSEDEDHGSSITTDLPESQNKDPSFHPPPYHLKTLSRVSISTKALPKTRAKAKPPAKRTKKKHLESPKFTNSPRQATLRGFGFSSTTSNQKESTTNKVVEKKRFKLFDNDLMPNIANETALFQKTTAKKTPKTTKKMEDLGNKRRCTECKKTFRSNLLLKKHVFIEHTTADLNSTEEFI